MQARAFRSVTRRQNLRARDREPHPSRITDGYC